MLYRCGRRRFRNRFGTFLIVLGAFLIVSFIIHWDTNLITVTNRRDSNPRLFCVLLQTQPAQERFVYLSNMTWAKKCHKIGIVRYKKLQSPDAGKLIGFSSIIFLLSRH
jgi:hypothetical protein